LAYALAASDALGDVDSERDGRALARALRRLDGGERKIQAGPAELQSAMLALSKHEPLAVQGIFGPFAWDERGVPSQSVLEVWCLTAGAAAPSFAGSGLQLEVASGRWRGTFQGCGRPARVEPREPTQSSDASPTQLTPLHQVPPAAPSEPNEEDAGVPEPERPELFAEYKADNTDAYDGVIGASVRVHNRGSGQRGLPLRAIKLRYYLTAERSPLCLQGCATELFWAGILPAGDRITARIDYVPSGWVKGYLEVSFPDDAPALRPREYAEVHLQFHMPDYAELDESNDYSFDGTQQSFGETQRIAVLENDELVWGDPPAW
jgi:hypothetical protein